MPDAVEPSGDDWIQFGPSQLRFSAAAKTFDEADEICQFDGGGYVVEIQLENEQRFIEKKLEQMIAGGEIPADSKVLIGVDTDYTKWSAAGDYFIHQNWCAGEPSATGKRVALDMANGACWTTVEPADSHPFVCESQFKRKGNVLKRLLWLFYNCRMSIG